ncbi:hypothetical protein M3J07_007236 [Ascochyta lentis]
MGRILKSLGGALLAGSCFNTFARYVGWLVGGSEALGGGGRWVGVGGG